ncbi:hypothetical protein ACQKKX_20425 [Neorhizobium sp. NPDC001467]|uniref:hypothetical protein n=1 Tax=Neorhizobium sp. NPDC001467 TaxID=3390595 RepID=UPI003CFD1F2C
MSRVPSRVPLILFDCIKLTQRRPAQYLGTSSQPSLLQAGRFGRRACADGKRLMNTTETLT